MPTECWEIVLWLHLSRLLVLRLDDLIVDAGALKGAILRHDPPKDWRRPMTSRNVIDSASVWHDVGQGTLGTEATVALLEVLARGPLRLLLQIMTEDTIATTKPSISLALWDIVA